MDHLPWSERFAVGHEELDRDHRRLVELINEVIDTVQANAPQEQLSGLLRELHTVAVEHIRQENTILWELRSNTYGPLKGRPQTAQFLKALAAAAFDEHVAEHSRLMTSFDGFRDGPVDTLCETLRAWFLDHAIKHDAHLKAIFQAAV